MMPELPPDGFYFWKSECAGRSGICHIDKRTVFMTTNTMPAEMPEDIVFIEVAPVRGDLIVFACSIMATKQRFNSVATGHGARVIRAHTLEETRDLAEKEAYLNWPKSDGWEVTYSFMEVSRTLLLRR